MNVRMSHRGRTVGLSQWNFDRVGLAQLKMYFAWVKCKQIGLESLYFCEKLQEAFVILWSFRSLFLNLQ